MITQLRAAACCAVTAFLLAPHHARASVYQTTCTATPPGRAPYSYTVFVDDAHALAFLVVSDADAGPDRSRIVPLAVVRQLAPWPLRIAWLVNPRVPGTTMSVRFMDPAYWRVPEEHRVPSQPLPESLSSYNGVQIVTDQCGVSAE